MRITISPGPLQQNPEVSVVGMTIKRTLVLLSVFALAACEMPKMPNLPSLPSLPSLSDFFFGGEGAEVSDAASCDIATRLDVKGLDWAGAKHLDIYLRKRKLSPSVVVLKANTPNVIRLFNSSKGVWSFRAEKFFRSSAIVKIVYGGKSILETCIDAIKIGSLKWAELYIVPLRQGEFFFGEKASSDWNLNPFATKGETGQIIVR